MRGGTGGLIETTSDFSVSWFSSQIDDHVFSCWVHTVTINSREEMRVWFFKMGVETWGIMNQAQNLIFLVWLHKYFPPLTRLPYEKKLNFQNSSFIRV